MNSFYKYYRWLVVLFFILILITNFLSSTGTLLPATTAEISDKYVNLLAPAGFTFSIWGLIYLGVVLTISIDFMKLENKAFTAQYRTLILPRMLEWMALNVLWLVAWSNEWLLASLLIILLYTQRVLNLVIKVSASSNLRNYPWLLKYPLGLHFGWLLVASFANLTTYLVSRGMEGTSFWGIVWAVGVLVILLATSAYYYTKYGNEMIMLPLLWTLIGVFAKHSPMSGFPYAEVVVMYLSVVLFIIGTVGYISLFRLQRKQKMESEKQA